MCVCVCLFVCVQYQESDIRTSEVVVGGKVVWTKGSAAPPPHICEHLLGNGFLVVHVCDWVSES